MVLYFDFQGIKDLFEDILRNDYHDMFWCNGYEREVSNYVNISSNKKRNKVTYSHFQMYSNKFKLIKIICIHHNGF